MKHSHIKFRNMKASLCVLGFHLDSLGKSKEYISKVVSGASTKHSTGSSIPPTNPNKRPTASKVEVEKPLNLKSLSNISLISYCF